MSESFDNDDDVSDCELEDLDDCTGVEDDNDDEHDEDLDAVDAVKTVVASTNRESIPTLSSFIDCPFGVFPPVVRFSYEGDDDSFTIEPIGRPDLKNFKWRYTKTTSTIIRRMLKRVGFRPTNSKNFWIGTWGSHMKAHSFKKVQQHQKLNHFPGSFCIGRKDSLWRNISAMRAAHGQWFYF